MVAIYRSGYGYIDHANGMTTSGLEDEYRFAKQEDIDSLFYICRSADGREPRLQSLIDEISIGTTIAYYEIPEQLHQRVKDDLTALITDKVLSASSHSGVIQENSKTVLTRTLNSVGVVVRRDDQIKLLVDLLKESSILCIYGSAGIGKTTVAAQFAQELGGQFVRASGLAPKEVFAVCADVLKGHSASEVTPFSTLDGARFAMAAAWAEIQSVTLILDECDYVSELLDAVSAGGGTTATKRIVYTSRESSVAHQSFEVPPLTHTEIGQIVANSPWQHRQASKPLEEGNPLILQQALMLTGATFPAEMLNTGESAGEILTYLALSPIPLTAEQLITLRADDSYSIGALIFDIDKLGPIVDDSPRGYRLMHSETAATIASQIGKSPQRYRFFVNRLIRLTERSGHFRHAFELASALGDGSARKYVARATREAARLGDWRLGVALTSQMLSEALDAESKSEAFHLMLSLVYPLELMGDAERAGEILERAKPLATQLGEAALISLEEVEISSRARRAMLSNDVQGLQNVYRRYAEQGKNWDQARVGLELSAIFLAAKNYKAAIEILHPTLSTFEEFGDDYGIDLTQRNLASALSAIPGKEQEAERLIALITEREGDKLDSRRQRAWLCNVLTRRLRTAGRHEEAVAMAKEAVDIATELGDESLRAVNLINLGNSYRGCKQPLEAIAAYEAAAISSQKSGRLDVQGDASRDTLIYSPVPVSK
jgi:tetratricopeptide (TPR) repeat protein